MKSIIYKELKELFRDGRFKIVLSTILILLALAIATGINQYQKNNQQYVVSLKKEREIWETQSEKNPHSAAHYGTYAFKPRFALSLFDSGISKYTGNFIFLEAHNRHEASFSEASDQTSLARFGTLSISFVLIYLFPLIIILIGYNIYTKEKEFKTFMLIKSQGISPIKLALGKWLSVFVPILILTIIIFLTLGIILSNLEGISFFSWADLVTLLGLYLLYYSIITTLTIWVSMISKTSGISLVLNLFLWIFFCFVTPKIATNIANSSYPYPSKNEFSKKIAEDKTNGLDGHNPWNQAAKELEKETLKQYQVEKISDLPFNYAGYRMQKGEEHEAKIYKKHYDALNVIAKNQNEVYKNLSFISPFFLVRFISMDIAHTSDQLHWDFTNAAENYRLENQKFLNDDIKDNSTYGMRGYTMTAEKFKKLPKFNFIPPKLSTIINNHLKDFLFLGLWFLIPFIGVLINAKKV